MILTPAMKSLPSLSTKLNGSENEPPHCEMLMLVCFGNCNPPNGRTVKRSLTVHIDAHISVLYSFNVECAK